MLTVEGVCEEGGEGFGALDCFSTVGGRRLDWGKFVLRIFLNCGRCRSNSSGSRANSKGTFATEAARPANPSKEGHY
jgi:hypothetical protein